MTKLIFLFISISFSAVFAQNSKRVFEKVEILENHTLKITVNDCIYKIVPYTKYIIETTFIPHGEDENKKSHAVILKPGNIETSFKEDLNQILLKTEGVIVKVKKSPFQINYYYKNKFLISEAQGYEKFDSLEQIDFNIKANEILYGGGARALGMNRRGNKLELYNKAHYGYETHSKLMNFTRKKEILCKSQ